MSFGGDGGAEIDFETGCAAAIGPASVSSTSSSRIASAGSNVVRRFETTDIRIVSLTIVDSADCAIIRIVLSDPERALEIFRLASLPFSESDLLVVKLPDGDQPLLDICKALLTAEINVHYAYPILVGPHGSPALALHVEDHEFAAQTLQRQDFVLFSENDFSSPD